MRKNSSIVVVTEPSRSRRFRRLSVAVALFAGLTVLADNASATVMYLLRNSVDYPTGPNFDDKSGTLTPATVDSHETVFSTNPGNPADNHFDGLSTITGGPFRIGLHSLLTIGQATTGVTGILTAVAANVSETGVTITGGSGTGYLLPTFRVTGSFNDGNPSVEESVTMCAGNGSCILNAPAFTTGGFRNVDFLYSPAADSTTSFQFGTSFSIDYSVAVFNSILSGSQAMPGGPVTADFTNGVQLVSMRVVNGDGNVIPSAVIHSELLNIAGAPEPGSILLCGTGLLLAGVRGLRWTPKRQVIAGQK
jgi:hypothetical protein